MLVATSGATNFTYLVGSDYGRSERLIALVLPVDGKPTLVAPAFEVERVRRGSRIEAAVRGWEEQEDPFALLRDVVRASGTTDAVIVLEPKTDYWTAMAVGRALPNARLIDGSEPFEQLRLVKSDEEIVRMRRAIEWGDRRIASLDRDVRSGSRRAVWRARHRFGNGLFHAAARESAAGGDCGERGDERATVHGQPGGLAWMR